MVAPLVMPQKSSKGDSRDYCKDLRATRMVERKVPVSVLVMAAVLALGKVDKRVAS